MSVLVKEFNNNFTQVPNSIFVDKNVSLAAKGLYSYFISKPQKWDFGLNGLTVQLKESRPTILKIIEELCKFGYMKKIKKRINGKQSTNNYLIFDKPTLSVKDSESKSLTQKHRLRNTDSEILTTSNTITSNTITSNTLSYKGREINFKKFKKILSGAEGFEFRVTGLDYSKEHDGFKIKNGYIFSLQIQMLVDNNEAYKIWSYLFDKKEDVLKLCESFKTEKRLAS